MLHSLPNQRNETLNKVHDIVYQIFVWECFSLNAWNVHWNLFLLYSGSRDARWANGVQWDAAQTAQLKGGLHPSPPGGASGPEGTGNCTPPSLVSV